MAMEDEKNKTIAVVTYLGVALLDLVVTQTVLDRGTKYQTVSVGERTEPIASDTPMAVVPEKRFEEVPDPLALIVPGGDALDEHREELETALSNRPDLYQKVFG